MSSKTSYWLAYLKHPVHITGLLGCVLLANLASVPWGGDAFALGLIAIAAIETVLIAVVPSLPPFRQSVDRANRQARLDSTRQALLAQVKALGGSPYLDSFHQMQDRVASLFATADDPTSTLTRLDVEQLEDAAVDYLRLCLSDASLKQRPRRGVDSQESIEAKLEDVRASIRSGKHSQQQVQQFKAAEAALSEAVGRHTRMAGRRTTLEASLLSIPLRMEEVYQMVMTSPRSGNLGSMLEDSLSKLRVTEEVAMDLDAELGLASVPHTLQRQAAVPASGIRPTNTTRH